MKYRTGRLNQFPPPPQKIQAPAMKGGRRKGGKEERRKGGKEERRKGGKEERRKGGKDGGGLISYICVRGVYGIFVSEFKGRLMTVKGWDYFSLLPLSPSFPVSLSPLSPGR